MRPQFVHGDLRPPKAVARTTMTWKLHDCRVNIGSLPGRLVVSVAAPAKIVQQQSARKQFHFAWTQSRRSCPAALTAQLHWLSMPKGTFLSTVPLLEQSQGSR